jgi:predicted MFS family arabinose efflux permease
MYFQCVNMVSIYNSEIDAYFGQYEIGIYKQTLASIINCVAGIAGSLYLGKLLDKYRNYKRMQIYVALGVSLTVFATFLSLKFDAPHWVSILITILGGAPMSSVSVVSYQF